MNELNAPAAPRRVRYKFDHVSVTTINITTDRGEEAAREAAGALRSIGITGAGDDGDLELAKDVAPGTVFEPTCMAPRGPAYLVYAEDASGAEVPASDDPCIPEPITGYSRQELSELLAGWRAAADGPSGDDEHDAAAALADAVAALLDEPPSRAATPPRPTRSRTGPDPLQEDRHCPADR